MRSKEATEKDQGMHPLDQKDAKWDEKAARNAEAEKLINEELK